MILPSIFLSDNILCPILQPSFHQKVERFRQCVDTEQEEVGY